MKDLIANGAFSSVGLQKMIKIAKAILPYAIEMDGRHERKGGYLCVVNRFGVVVAVILVGEVSDKELAQKYRDNCQKKALRLSLHKGHISGWQSRDEKKEDWGGSVFDIYGNVLGFSGFNERVDEAFSAAVSCGLDEESMPLKRQNKIAEISGNPHLVELCEKGADWDILPS
jgi:hypothetical protein